MEKSEELMEQDRPLTIDELWNTLPSDLRQKIFDNNYHFNCETALELWSYRDIAPLLVPEDSDAPEASIPASWRSFLDGVKKAHRNAESQERLQRNKAMARLSASGMSYREIGEKYELAPSTVGQMIRKLRRSDPEFANPLPKARKKSQR